MEPVVAEPAANAAPHGRSPGSGFELRPVRDEGARTVRVEVSGLHPGRPERGAAPVDADGGRGWFTRRSGRP
ncbi:hypothetical protein K701_08810 [Streptomyces fradiae ATCC 10745 = DSM 40063]|uniref:Uncharacterized protein n=1 Tax=Streptomyces fradiae ATCC 10745 = DSM 40063 TaxID=1319510 RepID=A0ABQ6XWZ0_STRFR|nr:hypothetical protein K701_08810 [Streptomyces fradiae ATCC 10745 = DSM 40063]QEV12311.1 hypothetical protein CP974_10035 [Streptomyces fradiae ATCC 10745 = DSM 40063]